MSLKEQYLAMDGANRFLMEHCEKTLGEIRELLSGASHSVNRCNAEYADCWKAVEELRERMDSQDKALSEALAAIGALQERMDKVEDWLRRKYEYEKASAPPNGTAATAEK